MKQVAVSSLRVWKEDSLEVDVLEKARVSSQDKKKHAGKQCLVNAEQSSLQQFKMGRMQS